MNEVKYVEDIINTGNLGDSPVYDATLMYRYYYQNGISGKELNQKVVDFMSLVCTKYTRASWISIVDKISKKQKRELFETSSISVSGKELNVINSFNKNATKEVAFTMLCLAKLYNIRNDKNNNWINTQPRDVFKIAGVTASSQKQAQIYRELMLFGFITISKKITNMNACVNVIDNEDIALEVCTMKNLGYEYLNYIGSGRFYRCARCGVMFRQNKHGARKYCKNCSDNTKVRIRRTNCIDCGNEVVVMSRNWRTCRCASCQAKETARQKKLYKMRETTKINE